MANPSSLSSSLLTGYKMIDFLINSGINLREFLPRCRDTPSLCKYDEMYDQWLAWTRNLKENQDTSGVTRSQKVPCISKTDLLKSIENYATTIESNLEKAYEIMRDVTLQFSITHSLEKEFNTLRWEFKKAYQEMHRHSLNVERLVDIFCELEETSIYTVELLQDVKNFAEFCKQLPSTTSKYDFYQFFCRTFGPIIKNFIIKFNILMLPTYLIHVYAASVIYYIISIIALLLFICQSTLGPATDMEQLMIFATVIHLIICGDVESNPGPQYDAKNLLRKKPKISDFQRIFIQSGAARHWQIFARALDIDMNDPIYCSQSAKVMIGTVFESWRDRHKDFTWKRIIRACEGYDEFGEVCRTIDRFLSSREAHEKYGDEPDFESEESRRSENDHSNNTDSGPVIAINVHVHVHIHVSS